MKRYNYLNTKFNCSDWYLEGGGCSISHRSNRFLLSMNLCVNSNMFIFILFDFVVYFHYGYAKILILHNMLLFLYNRPYKFSSFSSIEGYFYSSLQLS